MRRLYATLFLLFALFSRSGMLSAQCPVVDAGDDLFLCSPPGPAQLNGSIDGPYLNFRWMPTAGLIGTNTLSPSVNVTQSTTYYLIARGVDPGNNLIVNGDFEAGNSGFLSDYLHSPGDLVPEGVYEVLPNPQASHPSFAPCSDHTSGSGNMMAVNGSGVPGTNVWCQTVSVSPNTEYAFSAWVATLVAASPAILQFSINGVVLGTPISAPPITCNWINFYQIWNSGGNSSATICIVNQNTTLGGNDFALDDIVFSPICEVRDSVRVNIVNIQAQASPLFTIIPCEGTEVTLNGTGSSVGPDITYSWDTPNGNIVSGANTLNPVVNMAGAYTLTVTFNNGQVECTKTATVNVNPSPNPLVAWVAPPTPIGCGSSTSLLIGNSSQPAFSNFQWTAGPGGNIVSGANSAIAIVDEPGTYTLLVTNTTTGCTAETSVIVLEATNPPVAVATTTITEFNCFSTSFPLDGTGSSAGNNISYVWTALNGGNIVNNPNFQTTLADAPGTYILTVTNTSNGCAASDTIVVAANLTPPVVTLQPPGMFTCNIDTISLSGSVNNSTSLTTWTTADGGAFAGDSSLLNVLALTPGTYILGALDTTNFCYGADTVTVVIDTLAPLAVALPADTITCQQPSLSLSGAGSSVGPNISYLWTTSGGGNIVSGDTSLNPVVNAAGLYTLVVTNNLNACTADSSVVVYADDDALVAVANAPDTLTCADTLASLNANGSSAVPGLLFAWTTSDGVIVNGADTPTPTVSAPGIYQLLLTNPDNGCTATDDATVLQNIDTPLISIAPPDTLTCANPTLTLQGQNAAPGNFIYQWMASGGGNILSGDSTLTPTVNSAGVYTLLAINLQNGCTAQVIAPVEIEAGTPVAVAGVAGPINCDYPTRTIDASGSSGGPNFDFSWTASGGGNIVSGGDSPAPVVDAPGSYTLVITNVNNGCTATTTVPVSEDTDHPPANAGPDGLITCADPVFNLSANSGTADPGLDFFWQTTTGNFLGDPDSAAVLVDQAGTYILTVLNPQNGCSTTDTTDITADQVAPGTALLPPGTLTCSQPTVSLGLTGGAPQFVYQWQTTTGQFVSGQTSAEPVVDAPGLYELLVTDTVNGCTAVASVNVEQDTVRPLAGAGPALTLTCIQTQQVLQGSAEPGPGMEILWTVSGGGNIVSGQGTPTPVVDAPGIYIILVTDTGNGCTSTAQVIVTQDTIRPAANAGPNATLSCSVSSLRLQGQGSASGTAAFSWTALAGGNIVADGNSLFPVIDAPGVYVLIVTDLTNGCTRADSVLIAQDATAPVATVAIPGTLTCAVTQLTLQGNGSAGPSFSPLWSASTGGNIISGASTLSPVVNAPGTYTLTITNLDNGCTASAQGIVAQNTTPPTVSIAPPELLTCANPAINLSAMPAGPNFSYFWQTTGGFIVSGGTTPAPVVASPGAYSLLVTNNTNGCTASAATLVGANTATPVISAAAPDTLTCAVQQVFLQGSVLQPAGNFSVGWTTANGQLVSGQQTLMPAANAPGNYVLTVQDQQNGCSSTATVVVAQNIQPPVATISPAPEITCAQPQATLDASVSSGQGTLVFQWAGSGLVSGGASANPQVSASATYTVTVTDSANGCTNAAEVSVPENTDPPVVQIAPPLPRTCARDTVVLDAGASSSGPEFTYSWTTANGHIVAGQSTPAPLADAPGLYTLVIQNVQNGCSASASIAIINDFAPPLAEAGPGATLDCNHPEAVLAGSSSTPVPLAFQWSAPVGSIVSGSANSQAVVNAPGIYLLTVTRLDNGCTASDTVAVTAVPLPAFTPAVEQPDCLRPKGSLAFGPVDGGRPPFRYSINGGQSFQPSPNFNGLSPGAYSLVVSDALGCSSTAPVSIDEPFFPTVVLDVGVALDLGDSVQLTPILNILYSQVADWAWSPLEGLSCADCPAPWARPLRPTTYQLTITDLNGCTATARVLVPVDRRRQLYAPNIFSPNDDGQNDRFLLFGRGVTEIQALRIFDRWGNQVFLNEHFQPNDEAMGWDGTFQGQRMNPGVFVWQAVVEFVDGAVEVFAGDVTLYR